MRSPTPPPATASKDRNAPYALFHLPLTNSLFLFLYLLSFFSLIHVNSAKNRYTATAHVYKREIESEAEKKQFSKRHLFEEMDHMYHVYHIRIYDDGYAVEAE